MRMTIGFIALITLSGCTSLPEVNRFSSETIALADAIDQIAQDTSASCLRRLALDVPVKGLTELQRQSYAQICSQLKQASDTFIDLNGTTRAYARVLGQLADDKLVLFDSEIAGAKDALARLESTQDVSHFNAAQLDAVSALANLVVKATTDAYRRKQIKQILDHHDDLAQLATLLRTFINRAYLPALENEQSNLDSLEEILKDRYIASEPLRAREMLESLTQRRAALSDRRKTANDVLTAITKMLEVHAALQKKPDKALVGLLNEYGRQIRHVKNLIHTSF